MLHGRAREIAVVDRVLDTVAAGRHRVLVVDGEAGIGKTTLLGAVADTAAGRGFRVFAAAVEPAERGRPFAALARLFGLSGRPGRAGTPADTAAVPGAAALAGWLDSVDLPGRWTDPAVELGFRVADATVELIEGLAAESPVLLVLDDVHRADPASALVLDALHRRLAGLPVALVLAVRSGDPAGTVQDAPADGGLLARLGAGATTLTLPPLGEDAVRAMVGDLTGARAGGRLDRQLAKAGGNPFFVTELVRVLDDEGMLTVDRGTVESRAGELPAGLAHTVLRRLRLLPSGTVELLRLAAVLGQSFSVTELALVARTGAVELARGLAPALAAHTLRGQDDELAFGHPLTWESVYHDQPVAIRQALHREVAGLLADAGVPPARVVRHFALGARRGDTEAVGWLRRAARDVAAGSPTTAAELLGRALELAGPTDSIVAELAPLLVVIGEVDQARELTERALARGVAPGAESRLRVGLTHVLMRRGHVGDAKVQALRLLELAPPEAADLVGGIAGYVVVAAGDADRAEELAERAVEAGTSGGHDLVVATALSTLTWTYAAHGRVADAVAAGHRAVAATEECTASMSGLLFPHCPLGAALLQADRFAEADRSFRDGLARAERTAAPGSMVYHQAGIAATRFLGEDWDEAVSEAETALDVADKTATSWVLLPSAVLARIAVARDDLATARSVVESALRAPEAGHLTMTLDWLHWAHAVLLHADGSAEAAVAAAERAWRVLPTMRDLIGNRVVPIDCVRIALAAGNRPLAEEIADWLTARAAAPGGAPGSLTAAADHCRGLVTADAGPLGAAVDRLRGSPRRYQWAMANEDTALATADRARSRPLFAAALDGYRSLGAGRDAARVAAAMRARGLRPAAGARQDGAALTRTELAVAGLVAEGLSNPGIAQRLFISRHTAETHMKHIFAKLGLSSRAELAALVAGGGLEKYRTSGMPTRS